MLDVEEEIEVATEAQVNVRNMIFASRCNFYPRLQLSGSKQRIKKS
jgi:hypothetical protein